MLPDSTLHDCARLTVGESALVMGLDVPQRRPLARLAARSAIQGIDLHDWHVGPYVPPATLIDDGLNQVSADVRELCISILRGLLLGEDLLPVRGRLATDLVTWGPHIFTVSRDQILTSIDRVARSGDTLSEVALEVTNIGVAQPRVYVEWRLTARFTHPGFLDDDKLLEPTGRLFETAGLQVVTFNRDQVVSVHCYHDDLALLEQLILSR